MNNKQLGMQQMTKPLFIYFKHTPKGIRFIPSYDTTPKGQPKTLIRTDDNNAMFIAHVLRLLKLSIKAQQNFNPAYRPSIAQMFHHLTKLQMGVTNASGQLSPGMVELMSHNVYAKVLHLPANTVMSERFCFMPKNS